MFRKTITTLSLSAVAAVALITFSAPVPASAVEPGLCLVDLLTCIAQAAGAFDDDDPETEPVPTIELEVIGGITSGAAVETVMQLPEDFSDALSEPLVEIPSDLDLVSDRAPSSDIDDEGGSDGEVATDPVPEIETESSGETIVESTQAVTPKQVSETPNEPAPAVARAEQVPTSATEQSDVPASASGATSEVGGEESEVAISVTADGEPSEGLDPMMAAVLGGLGVLAIVMIMMAAFNLGRRSS